MFNSLIKYSFFNFSNSHIDPSKIKFFADQLILVNKKDQQIGSISKLKAHLKSENNQNPHRAFSVFLFNKKNELLLQQRSSKKVTFPLLWSNTCCSHPLNIPGERETEHNKGILNAIVKRVKFEMGISTSLSKYIFFDKILYKADSDSKYEEYELDYLFLIKDKSRKMKEKSVRKLMNKDEVENVKFCSYDYLKHDLINRPNIYTPWFKFIMEKKGKKIFEVSENNGINYKYDGKIINLL